jgi:CDP-diacylglycerol--glycerol-3-phosphate 3-phosphatidyltransferase
LLAVPILFYTVSAGGEVSAVAVGLLLLAWGTDVADGWLARRLGSTSELGRVLDPLADKMVIGATAVALWITRDMPGWLVVCLIGRDVAIVGFAVVMRERLGHVPPANVVGKIAVIVFGVTLAAYLVNATDLVEILTWLTLVAVVGSSISYGYRFVCLIRHRVRP